MQVEARLPLKPVEGGKRGESVFELDAEIADCGLHYYKVRIFPSHRLLTHPFETGCMVWL